MLKVLGGLKEFLKKDEITIDCPIFRFHNIFTAVLLFACSLIITATQYVGSPIQCIVDGLPAKPVNTYCWIMSTFTIPKAFDKELGHQVPHPGVDSEYGDGDESAKKYYSYYQWVCFVLFFQGLACYVPKWIWDMWEGGLMKTLVMGMNHHIFQPDEKRKKKQVLLSYLLNHIQGHRLYALRYWVCEFLCLVNVFLQLYMMNWFFSGEFYSYGLRVITMLDDTQETRNDPMVYVFPRVTKCTFHKYGPSGSVQKHDSLCVLPLNIVNEKTYVIIWFWFVILAGLLILLMLYRIFLIVCPSLRPRLLYIRRKVASTRDAEIVTRKLDIGDWWVLYMLGKNLDPLVYNEVVVDLARKLDDPDATLKR